MNLKGIDNNVIMLDSVSKRYSECGVRIGALITKNKDLISTALKFAQARLSPPGLGQIVGEASIDTPEHYFKEVNSEYAARRNYMVDALNKIPGVFCPEPKGAFYTSIMKDQEIMPSELKILIVDDDKRLCQLVTDYLNPMGYEVESAHNGVQGLQMILEGSYHAVILDVMMPQMDGFEVLKRVRMESDLPVLMLTARGEETDRIVGLEMGADDYLPKTFSSRELLARLRAVTRRYSKSKVTTVATDIDQELVFADLHIDQGSRAVSLAGKALDLTPVEYDILLNLARAAGRVLTRDQLLDAVAGRNYEVFDRSVDVHISSLRHKLGDNPRKPRFIQTVRTAGYMFKAQSIPS